MSSVWNLPTMLATVWKSLSEAGSAALVNKVGVRTRTSHIVVHSKRYGLEAMTHLVMMLSARSKRLDAMATRWQAMYCSIMEPASIQAASVGSILSENGVRLAQKMRVGHAFLWECSYKRLKSAQLLGQLSVLLTLRQIGTSLLESALHISTSSMPASERSRRGTSSSIA